jgi:NAD(P)-dependent dehydrogenase (short-subunit alcohol dehydrogenase family)
LPLDDFEWDQGHTMNDTGRPVGIVTGASGGIGRWIALGLARAGHHVVLVCRDRGRGEEASNWIATQVPGADTELRLADLRSLAATREVGRQIAADHPKIALLVNNAGLFTAKRHLTAEGREAVLTVNHLAPYVLTDAVEHALIAGAPARIVNVGSSLSDTARMDPDDLELALGWAMQRAYGRSKLAMMMATFARAKRLGGTGVVANVVHPGLVATGLIKEGGAIGLAWRIMGLFARSAAQGADAPLHAALSPDFARISGAYITNHSAVPPNPLATDFALIDAVETATRRLIV